MKNSLTIIIPSYNDASGLERVLPELLRTCTEKKWACIVVDDGSTDETRSVLSRFKESLTVVVNNRNKGYGASIKRGIRAANTTWVATMDADGQHRLEDLERMTGLLSSEVDAVIGVRDAVSNAPLVRKPGKWVLRHAANLITGETLQDINCGLRILRRTFIDSIFNLTSDRFSFSTSTLVALTQLGANIKYCSVTLEPRIGKSSVRQIRDGLQTLLLLMRLIILFNPMRILLPVGAGVFGLGVLYQLVGFVVYGPDISDTTTLLVVTGLIIFVLALMTDQISALRRDLILKKTERKEVPED